MWVHWPLDSLYSIFRKRHVSPSSRIWFERSSPQSAFPKVLPIPLDQPLQYLTRAWSYRTRDMDRWLEWSLGYLLLNSERKLLSRVGGRGLKGKSVPCGHPCNMLLASSLCQKSRSRHGSEPDISPNLDRLDCWSVPKA